MSPSINKEIKDLREDERRHKVKKLDSTLRRFGGDWLSAINRQSQLDFITYIQPYDRSPWAGQYYITNKEFTHSLAVIFASITICGYGLGQVISEIFGR